MVGAAFAFGRWFLRFLRRRHFFRFFLRHRRAWATLAQTLSARARRGKAVNLDPAALLMDILLKVDEVAGSLAQR